MKYLGLCLYVKDENPFLEEWIAFHTLMGVEGFIIYDNASLTPVSETLRHLADGSFIRIHRMYGRGKQVMCYSDCCRDYGHEFAWLGFIDADEFALPVRHGDLRITLSHYENYAGVGVNWMVFGSSGHKTRPDGLQIENYTLTLPDLVEMNSHIKMFVRPERILDFPNPHFVIARPGFQVVNTGGTPLFGPRSISPAWDTVQLNHYYYRSHQDWYQKMKRPRGSTGNRHRVPERITIPPGTVEDLRAAGYGPAVRQLLKDSGSRIPGFAQRIPQPSSPEEAAAMFSEFMDNSQVQDALVLLAKASRQFEGNPLIMVLADQARKLEALLVDG